MNADENLWKSEAFNSFKSVCGEGLVAQLSNGVLPKNREESQLAEIFHNIKIPEKPRDVLPYVPPNIRQGLRTIVKPPVVLSDKNEMENYIKKREELKEANKLRKIEERKEKQKLKVKNLSKSAIWKKINKINTERKKKLKIIVKQKKVEYKKMVMHNISSSVEKKVIRQQIAAHNKRLDTKSKEQITHFDCVSEKQKLSQFIMAGTHPQQIEFDFSLN